MNGAYYSLMVISHLLMEAFRYDIASEILPLRCYATRFRREIIDIAVKVIRKGHQIILKTTRSVWDTLNVNRLWNLCNQQISLC